MNTRIIEIIRKCHKSLYTELSGTVKKKNVWKKVFGFDVLPGVLAIWFILTGNLLNKDSEIINYLLITCSIFAGLLFSLIIVIVDKAKKIKDQYKEGNEGQFYYLSRYLRFSKHLITKISFAILVALVIIILAGFNEISFGFSMLISKITQFKFHITSFLIYYFSIQFFLLIIHIISEMYTVFLEEIAP